MSQEHTKFKFFTKTFNSEADVHDLLREVEQWGNDHQVGPKSIGVEYVESTHTIVMSMGYRSDENYSVKMYSEMISVIKDEGDYGHIEADISKAAAEHPHIICHEMFITANNELYMVFMTHE